VQDIVYAGPLRTNKIALVKENYLIHREYLFTIDMCS